MISAISPRVGFVADRLDQILDRRLDHAGAADADVDHAIGLAGAVEGPGHERVVGRGVGEDDELGAAEAVVVAGPLGGVDQDPAQREDRVHVDARGRRADVDRGADPPGRREDLGQGLDQAAVALGPALLDQRREPADEVDPDLLGHRVERPGHGQVALGGVRRGDRGDRADGDPPVDDRDAVPPLDLQADRLEPAGDSGAIRSRIREQSTSRSGEAQRWRSTPIVTVRTSSLC